MRILSTSFQHLVQESGLRHENANRRAIIVLEVGLLRVDSSFVTQRAQPFQRFIWLSIHRVTHADHIKALHLVLLVHWDGRKQSFVLLKLFQDDLIFGLLRFQLRRSSVLQLLSRRLMLVLFRFLLGSF